MHRRLQTCRGANLLQRPQMGLKQLSCSWLTACMTQSFLQELRRCANHDFAWFIIVTHAIPGKRGLSRCKNSWLRPAVLCAWGNAESASPASMRSILSDLAVLWLKLYSCTAGIVHCLGSAEQSKIVPGSCAMLVFHLLYLWWHYPISVRHRENGAEFMRCFCNRMCEK